MAPNAGPDLSNLGVHLLFDPAGAALAGTFVFVFLSVLDAEETPSPPSFSLSSFVTIPMGSTRFARLDEGGAEEGAVAVAEGVGDVAVTEEEEEGGSTLPGDLRVLALTSTFSSSKGGDRVEGERGRGAEDDDDEGGTLKKLLALATSICRDRSQIEIQAMRSKVKEQSRSHKEQGNDIM